MTKPIKAIAKAASSKVPVEWEGNTSLSALKPRVHDFDFIFRQVVKLAHERVNGGVGRLVEQ